MKGKFAKAPTGKTEEIEDDNDDSGEKKQ